MVRVQMLANGSALSREKAHVHREAVVVILIEQNGVTRKTMIISTSAPACDPITLVNMYGSACP